MSEQPNTLQGLEKRDPRKPMGTAHEANAWPDTIHDGLAAGGKEMSRLGEERQRLTHDFAAWLVAILKD